MNTKRQLKSDDNRKFYLGWPSNGPRASRIGFQASDERNAGESDRRDDLSRAVAYCGDSHYLCIAPTGAGKTRSVVISNLLSIRNASVVLDIKGELANVTAERRRRLGHRIHVLDCFGLTNYACAGLNPLDLFRLCTCDTESDSQMIASNLSTGFEFRDDPFWTEMGTQLAAGIISYLADADEDIRNLNSLVNYLFADDVVYGLALLMDSGKIKSKMAQRALAATLQLPERTRECVIATAQSYVAALQSSGIQRALVKSSFDLADFVSGEPMTIYICIPPTKLRSHASLLRLWIGTLLAAVCSRETNPLSPTWFFIDEAAQLGSWPQLEQVLTLLRGYGVQAATFWQDLSQLKSLYPRSWPTITSNAAAVQTFGVSKWQAAKDLADLFGNQPEDLLRLRADETLVLNGDELQVCHKLDYLRDPVFAGKYRPNPRFPAIGGQQMP